MTSPPTEHAASPSASPSATVAALTSGAAIRWWQATALLEVRGPDALTFLDGLCTQAVTRIEVGTARLGLFLDAKAKIVAPAVLWRVDDAPWTNARTQDVVEAAPRVLLEVPHDCIEPLRTHLRKYRLRAKADIEPIDDALVVVAGPSAAALVAEVGSARGIATSALDLGETTERAFFMPGSATTALIDDLAGRGAVLADCDAWEATRIERGTAGLHDLLPGRMPAEVGGMEHAVALDAGCYLGQEPVARLHYRGHANRTLRRVQATDAITPPRPADDTQEARDACLELRDPTSDASRACGRLTTWARHPDGHVIGFAVLRREMTAGTTVQLPGDAGTFSVSNDAPE
jgi:folate-binding protein YgfZ